MATTSNDEREVLWTGLAGFVLMISGAVTIVQGLWALDHRGGDVAVQASSLLSYANLEAWGWIVLTWGAITFVTSFAVFARQPWARTIGMTVAAISLVLMAFWIFAFPIAAFSIIVLDLLVIYGLYVYGETGRPSA
jgi:hypothetical protein